MNNCELAIFIHVGDDIIFGDIIKYLSRLGKMKYDLYININCFTKSKIFNDKLASACKIRYPVSKIFRFENRGCDIGPFFLFLDYLDNENKTYKWIMKLHTKTDKVFRTAVLNYLLPIDFMSYYNYINNNNITIDGKFKYLYDYINIHKDIKNIRLLNLNVRTTWIDYIKKYNNPNTNELKLMDPIARYYYIRHNKLPVDLIPDIDIDLYNQLFKSQVQNNIISGNEKFQIIKLITQKKNVKNNIWYLPGSMFICKHNILKSAFINNSYKGIYNSLENGKLDDNIIQSNTHSWERIIPIIFQYVIT